MTTAKDVLKALRHLEEKSRADYEDMVKGPGKFEGEEPWVPYYYEVYLDGEGDYIDSQTQEFDIEPEDLQLFPELKGSRKVRLYFSDVGFVSGEAI